MERRNKQLQYYWEGLIIGRGLLLGGAYYWEGLIKFARLGEGRIRGRGLTNRM